MVSGCVFAIYKIAVEFSKLIIEANITTAGNVSPIKNYARGNASHFKITTSLACNNLLATVTRITLLGLVLIFPILCNNHNDTVC